MLNDALFYDTYETIGGEKFMSPAPRPSHSRVIGGIYNIISTYLHKNKCGYAFTDNIDVYLPDGNIFRPDLVVVTKKNFSVVDWNKAIFGVPDMVAEVLSKSTMRRDFTVKKDIYESNGVKEYWIVDPWKESISVYHLRDGKYIFDEEYVYYNKDEWEDLTDEQRAEAKFDIKVSIFDDCTVNINDVFNWLVF